MKGRVKPETSIKYTHVFTCPHIYANEDECTCEDYVKPLLQARPADVLTARTPAPNSKYGKIPCRSSLWRCRLVTCPFWEQNITNLLLSEADCKERFYYRGEGLTFKLFPAPNHQIIKFTRQAAKMFSSPFLSASRCGLKVYLPNLWCEPKRLIKANTSK